MERSFRRTVVSAGILALGLLISVTFLFFSEGEIVASHTDFTSAVSLTGWMWSGAGNDISGQKIGLGWISLNCSNTDSCDTSNYSVQINPDMTVTGYGWSPYTGWVRFGGLNGCPAGTCTARVVAGSGDTWELSGWARACAVFASGCSGTLKPGDDLGDWDGWISLNCENTGGCGVSAYSVSIPAEGGFTTTSNAWGGNVLGRVNFAFANFTPPCTPHNTCSADQTQSTPTNLWCQTSLPVTCASGQECSSVVGACVAIPTIAGSFIVNQAVVKEGDQVMLTWNVPGTNSCWVRGSDGYMSAASSLGSGTETSLPITQNRTTYTLTCIDTASGITVDVASTTVMRAPSFIET